MALFRFYLLSAAICSVLVVGHGLEEAPTKPPVQIIDLKNLKISVPDTTLMPETTIHPDTTTHPDTTSTTIPSTTSTTTPSTTSTTTPSTTSTTTPSTTSTTTPSTTTSTTPSTTSSTTPSTTTSTTTQAPPSPTPKPVPGPPEMGKWTYSDKNVTCIMVQFAAQLNVTYPMANVSTLGSKFVNVPANASTTAGWCGAANQSLTISWPATADENNTIAIVFQINDTTNEHGRRHVPRLGVADAPGYVLPLRRAHHASADRGRGQRRRQDDAVAAPGGSLQDRLRYRVQCR
ncbi:hypothetical protein MSG28_001932 [Choristoneura fumiferana]|uniref:Uncharacterized protein n=1 Tax=Choristoneura fumiferana TaxID=7141 RepID=A0ACC0JTB5_CHOFU|nr:hypothetical protein MSG28_001932 [Choristoneura fumiferana]